MKPEEVRDSYLGFCSSHPHWQKKRRMVVQALAFLPVVLVGLFLLLVALNYKNWISVLLDLPVWLKWAAVATAGTLSGLMTLALIGKWSELQVAGNVEGDCGGERVGWGACVIILVVGVILGGMGPLVLSKIRFIPVQIKLLCHIFAVLPIVAILLGMYTLGTRSRGMATRKRPVWLVVLFVFLALLGMTMTYDIAAAVQNSRWTQFMTQAIPWYPKLQTPFVGLVTLLPLSFLVFCLWQVWVQVIPVKRLEEEQNPGARGGKTGFWTKVGSWFKRFFGISEAAEDEVEDEGIKPPEWLMELLDELPDGCRVNDGPDLLEEGETSAVTTTSGLELIFGGLSPTVDQERVFQRFVGSYREVIDFHGTGDSGEVEPSADLLIQGDPGVGKTTAILACALYAAFVRGQRVLLIVPNEMRQAVIKERLEKFLTEVMMHYYVRIGVLTQASVLEWVQETGITPHIIISTADSVEGCLYGSQLRIGEQFDKLNRILHLLEVVIVDDIMDFEDAERSHLPFILDKQRLLMESEYIPIQVVVTCPNLAKVAEANFGSRLFTEKRLRTDTNILSMLPRSSGIAWKVDLTAGDVTAALESLAVWCLRRELDVVLYRKGIDEYEQKRQEGAILRKAPGKQITILSDLDDPLNRDGADVDAIFYQVAVHQDVCLALRLHMGNDDTVLFSMMPEGEVREVIDIGIVPIVAGREATNLLVTHALSVMRFLRPLSPIEADTWSQFGVRYDDEGIQFVEPEHQPTAVLDLDSVEGVDEDDRYGAQIWPWIALHGTSYAHAPIKVHELPQERRRFYRRPRRNYIFIGDPGFQASEDAVTEDGQVTQARWRSNAGQNMREIDLVHLREVRLAWGGEMFVPDRISEVPEKGLIEFITKHWQGNGSDHYLPVFDVGWDIKTGQTVETSGGGEEYGFLMYNAYRFDRGLVHVASSIRSLMTDYGVPNTMQSVKYAYKARLSGILLCPRRLEPDTVSHVVGEALIGHWETGGDTGFWPELTSALNYGLESRVPGLSFFGRLLCFGLSNTTTDISPAVVWFVEPASGGRTVTRVLRPLLEDKSERKALLLSVRWFLEHLQKAKSRSRFVRRFGRIGYDGDEDQYITRIEQALGLVDAMIEKTDVMLGLVDG